MFAFRALHDAINKDSTTWTYTLEPSDGGTLLTESFHVHEEPTWLIQTLERLFAAPRGDMRPHVSKSLAGIKRIAESRGASDRTAGI